NRMGTVIPIDEVGTDAERTHAWTLEAANAANLKVLEFDVQRTPMSKPEKPGYIALQLDGVWLRAPYLHNGSVPTLRALLEPPQCRPTEFYRGYDVLDARNVGFVSQRCPLVDAPPAPGCPVMQVQEGCMPEDAGWLFDTAEKGNGNGGHEYGTDLEPNDKDALVEYLKQL